MELFNKERSQSPMKKIQDPGQILKKEKERENRISVSSSNLSYEWTQKDEYVTITIVIGQEGNKDVDTDIKDQELVVSVSEGRRLQVKLHEKIELKQTEIQYKGSKCIIKLVKEDPSILWPSLEYVHVPPQQDKLSLKQINFTAPFSPPKTKECKMEIDEEKEVIKIKNIKNDMVERQNEPYLTFFLYLSQLQKDRVVVTFSDVITVQFNTSDQNFLKNHPSADENSTFEWSIKPKHPLVNEQCNYKITTATIEMKLKKKINNTWTTISAPPKNEEAASVDPLSKNTWVNLKKQENAKPTAIPPAPPVPPTFSEAKKPTCLVSPGKSWSSNTISIFPISSISSSSEVSGGSSTWPRGTSGLDNIGNTCFMNSVLQCLFNTTELRTYFIGLKYQQDLNKENPLGMGGKLAISFANLIRLMWSGNVRSHAPSKLKGIMSLKANQFSGFAQHDAQEFMVELLDGLHEDLNRIKKKPYIAEPPDLDGWTDHDAAKESWRLHRLRNDSIIDDLFKGQFKSTLTCHQCQKVSVKFDEFCCLSVPIPKDKKDINIVFFWRDTERQPKRFQIRLPADSSTGDLCKQLSTRTGVQKSAVRVIEVHKNKFYTFFSPGSSLANVTVNDYLMAFEILTERKLGEPVVELAITQRLSVPNPSTKCAACSRSPPPTQKLKRCTKCYKVGYCDTSCQNNNWAIHKTQCQLVPEPIGTPFIISLPESEATYSNLSRMVESYARFSVNIFQPPVVQTQTTRRRGSTSSGDQSSEAEEMEVDSEGSGSNGRDPLSENGGSSYYSGEDRAEADWPLRPTVRRGSPDSSSNSGGEEGEEIPPQLSSSPKISKVVGTYPPSRKTLMAAPATQLFTLRPVNSHSHNVFPPFGDILSDKGSEVLDLKDIGYLAMDWQNNERLPVYCLIQNKDIECDIVEEEFVQRSHHTSLEACIDLFTRPENLSEGDSWRCPSCKKPVEATKQMSIWRLPTVLIIQLKRFSFKHVLYSDKIDKFVEYPIKELDVRPFMSDSSTDSPAMYDLYGVINHMGRLLGGHYTAYCRTVDQEDTAQSEIDWRLCDDSRVHLINNDSRIVHDQAYLLLYRRRNFPFSCTVETPLVPEEPMEIATPSSGGTTTDDTPSSGGTDDPPSTMHDELD